MVSLLKTEEVLESACPGVHKQTMNLAGICLSRRKGLLESSFAGRKKSDIFCKFGHVDGKREWGSGFSDQCQRNGSSATDAPGWTRGLAVI